MRSGPFLQRRPPTPPPPLPLCSQEKLVTKNKTTGRRGGRGRKVVPVWFVPSGIDPVDVWEVPQPGVRDRVPGSAGGPLLG